MATSTRTKGRASKGKKTAKTSGAGKKTAASKKSAAKKTATRKVAKKAAPKKAAAKKSTQERKTGVKKPNANKQVNRTGTRSQALAVAKSGVSESGAAKIKKNPQTEARPIVNAPKVWSRNKSVKDTRDLTTIRKGKPLR